MLDGEEAASGSLPPAGLSSVAQDLQALLLQLTTPAMGTSTLQLGTPSPPPWQYASMTLSYPTSF